MTVKNEYGVEINFNAAIELMDDSIREELSNKLAPCSDQDFFDAYCEAHLTAYGEEWELAKENPVY